MPSPRRPVKTVDCLWCVWELWELWRVWETTKDFSHHRAVTITPASPGTISESIQRSTRMLRRIITHAKSVSCGKGPTRLHQPSSERLACVVRPLHDNLTGWQTCQRNGSTAAS